MGEHFLDADGGEFLVGDGAASPRTVSRCQEIDCTPCTMPMSTPALARMGPCSRRPTSSLYLLGAWVWLRGLQAGLVGGCS